MFSKRGAPNNAEDWCEKWVEISHMRPIQAPKLNLFELSIQGKLTLMSINRIKNTNMFSE